MDAPVATTLHQQLKALYVGDPDAHEVRFGDYRIDAVADDGRLIEVQCASLSAVRDKIEDLTKRQKVTVVTPLATKKMLLKKARRDGEVVSSRYSPAHETLPYIFLELVHFTNAFPHRNLQLDILLTEQEEIRVPRKKKSWRRKHSVEDRRLVSVEKTISVKSPADLWKRLGLKLRGEFTTAELATGGEMPRWLAQKAAWCFRQMGYLEATGKRGNAIVYQRAVKQRGRRAA